MALYPKGGPRPTSSNAELAFYKALMKGLPPGWQAWHSLKLRLTMQPPHLQRRTSCMCS